MSASGFEELDSLERKRDAMAVVVVVVVEPIWEPRACLHNGHKRRIVSRPLRRSVDIVERPSRCLCPRAYTPRAEPGVRKHGIKGAYVAFHDDVGLATPRDFEGHTSCSQGGQL